MLRRLYDWVLHWAKTPYGPTALFVLSLCESSFFPLPPDPLLIALAISIPARAFRFALYCSVASVLGGAVGYLIGGLRRKLGSLCGVKRKRLLRVIGYLENNRAHMRYDEYLAAGYPIGSGVIEGACRHVVKDRMELSGMRWTVDGAQAMLYLRSIYLNGDWQEFDEHRIQAEQNTLYRQAA